MRLVHTQVWPALRNLQAVTSRTAVAMSASSNTRYGACPPSSSDRRLTVSADCRKSTWPISVEPVNVSLRTRGSAMMTSVSGPGRQAGRTCNVPDGPPASSHNSAIRSAVNGVCLAGLTIIVQPAASAGATLRASMPAGKFHGVTA